ncbi:MAG: type II toxin-antitoxin system VapC family toxin [Bacteroidetes bacterium]|nr:type II toxin-antitoxin system VapC family toxin [Bacteroidota bacterium]
MVITDFRNKTVFLDTAPLIYFIEGHSQYQQHLKHIFEMNDEGGFRFITSSITLLEVLVKPLRENQTELADQYKNILLTASGIEIFDITNVLAIKAAEFRAKYNLRTPDALQVATAIENKADYFLTNDVRLRSVSEIISITLPELS